MANLPELLADLEAKHAAATSGDWSAHKDGGVFSTCEMDGLPESLLLRCEQRDVAENAAFIAAVKVGFPTLIALAKLASEMRNALHDWRGGICSLPCSCETCKLIARYDALAALGSTEGK